MDDDRRPDEMREVHILDLLLILLRRKKFIISVTIGITILTAVISLFLTKSFRADTRILPPSQTQGTSNQLLSQLSGLAQLGLGGGGGIRTSGDLYVGLIKSRPVLDGVIDRMKLMELYRANNREEARQRLYQQVAAAEDKKTGIITISAVDKDPDRAAAMANTFVEEFRRLNKGLAVTEASQRRLFYEEQLKDVKEALVKSEESMRGFQEKTGTVKIDEQARAVLQNIAQARAQLAAKEVQLKVVRTYATQHNPDAQRLEEEIRGLREQVGRLEAKGGAGADPLMATGKMASVGTDYLRMMREVKLNEALYEVLLKQFEVAKLDEARDASVIQVLEKAEPPLSRYKPQRRKMVTIAFVVGLFISVFCAVLIDVVAKSRQAPENRERFDQILQLSGLTKLRALGRGGKGKG